MCACVRACVRVFIQVMCVFAWVLEKKDTYKYLQTYYTHIHILLNLT